MIYETAVILGTNVGNIVSMYHLSFPFGNIIVPLYGLFSGIFVGCLALAIAEAFNGIPIFARRVNFRRGLGIGILALAIGKFAGNMLYFFEKF